MQWKRRSMDGLTAISERFQLRSCLLTHCVQVRNHDCLVARGHVAKRGRALVAEVVQVVTQQLVAESSRFDHRC